MKYIVAHKPCIFNCRGVSYNLMPLTPPEINPNHILVASGGWESVILPHLRDTLTAAHFEAEKLPGFPRPFDPANPAPGSRILLLRPCGIGDLIMLSPALRLLRERLAGKAAIVLATFNDYADLVRDMVDEILPYPPTLKQLLEGIDYYVDFADPRKLFDQTEMTDYYLDSLGFDPGRIEPETKKPQISKHMGTSSAIIRAVDRLPGRLKILYAGRASTPIRELPDRFLTDIAQAHPELSFVVPQAEAPAAPNIFKVDTSGSLNDYVTAVAACDALISTDSSAYHIAAAFDKPALAIFGPINSRLRTNYHPKVVALDAAYQGQTCSSPCGISAIHHRTSLKQTIGSNRVTLLEQGTLIKTFDGQRFVYDPALGCPEMQARHSSVSPCLESISAERLLAAFAQVLALIDSPIREQT